MKKRIIINKLTKKADGTITKNESEIASIDYKGPGDSSVSAFDEESSIGSFLLPYSSWKDASAYDQTLVKYYNGKYNLPTVGQLIDKDTSLDDTLKTQIRNSTAASIHYGDWPSPETMFINEANSN